MNTSRDPVAPVSRTLPSGTVTFVFTDIEGSTQRWERHRAAMQAAVRRHDELVRGAIVAHDGHVFKTVGDAFCAAFERPEDAIAAILAAQRALAAEEFSEVDGLRVRAAIHTGTADERGGDYFGPPVNRVARLMAIGHGGQVLVSGVSADLVRDDAPAGATLRDLGEHRLRDLARPERVYQLVAADLAAEFPPLRSLDVLPNNLPRMPNALIGRETEVAEITALLDQHQLLTLVGSGGVGKTRTALQAAANLLDGSGDGVWFVELAPLTSGDYIPSAVARALGIVLPPDGEPLANLARALKTKRTLLVFDNCEHLVEAAAHVIAVLLRDCPEVRVLATSRQVLGIAAEASYRMPSLGVPGDESRNSLAASDAPRYASIVLFVERARAVDHRFVLSDENAPVVAEICRRLDGIPLAIELAASRVKILRPRQLLERLDARFRVLTGGNRDVLPRQQTLRALIDWSHDLLDERERTLFRRLGTFVDGFTLEAAIAVAGDEALDELAVVDVLTSLGDKSLVLAEPTDDSLRYRLIESTRAYAAEKLAHAGEADLLARRHLNFLRDRFAESTARMLRTARENECVGELRAELEDVRAAIDRALARGDAIDAGLLLADIGDTWLTLGLGSEGIARNEKLLGALPRSETRLIARVATALSRMLANSLRKARALEVANEAVESARASGDAATLAAALDDCAWVNLTLLRPDEAAKAIAEAEAIPDASNWQRVKSLRSRAFLCHLRKDGETAVRIWEQLRKEHRSLGNVESDRSAAICLAEVEHELGNSQRAIAIVREIITTAPLSIDGATTFSNLAGYLVAIGDLAGSAKVACSALRASGSEPDHAQAAFILEHLALVYGLRGDLERAALLEGYVDETVRRHGSQREYTETTSRDRLVPLLRAQLVPEEFARLMFEGAALRPEAAIALALEGTRDA